MEHGAWALDPNLHSHDLDVLCTTIRRSRLGGLFTAS